MRIVFYNHTGQVSGAEKMLLLGLRHLPRDSFETALVCPAEGTLAEEAEKLGVPVTRCRSLHARFTYNPLMVVRYAASILRTVLSLRKTTRAQHPDVLHANTVRAGIVATIATAGTGTNMIWHIHDMLPRHPLTILIRMLAYSSRRVHLVACSAAAAATMLPIGGGKGRPRVIHNGCELAPLELNEQDRARKRAELDLSDREFAIGSIGQLTPRKGVLELIRSFANVKQQLPDSVLLICGSAIFSHDEVYVKKLHEETAALGLTAAVRFLGHRPDAPQIMQALDLYVLNSKKEPFAISLIEAMMMEVPIVATDSGGPAEMFLNGRDGEIVPVGDPAALTEAILKLAGNRELRDRYRKAARKLAAEKYSRDRYIANWCECYRAIEESASENTALKLPVSREISASTGSRG
jgi:glycosyltransferase involved in cell wall biosynthesis